MPAIMKLEYGSSAIAAKIVHTLEEAVDHFNLVKSKLRNEMDHPGCGLGLGNSMVLSELLHGTEHDVDIILSQVIILLHVSTIVRKRSNFICPMN